MVRERCADRQHNSWRQHLSRSLRLISLPVLVIALAIYIQTTRYPQQFFSWKFLIGTGFTRIQDQFGIPILTPDLRDLRTSKLRLANGLKVFIVSDPGILKAGAALSVESGAWKDPPDAHGLGMSSPKIPLNLAHFTEHMLFMGSKKFPLESEYDRYISSHAGRMNAWTSSDHSVFYFNILPDAFLGALDRFSQFFVSPVYS
jgi:insulysin